MTPGIRGTFTVKHDGAQLHTSLEVDDISVLPEALKMLHSMDFDLKGVIEAVHAIEDEQRKREHAERLKAATKNVDITIRRFILAYAKDEEGAEIKVAEGALYSNGLVYIEDAALFPFGGATADLAELDRYAKRDGFVYHIEYIDYRRQGRLFPFSNT